MAVPHLIHIGCGKTATTWLQDYYFTRRDAGLAFVRDRKAGLASRLTPRAWDRRLLSRWERQIEAKTAGFYQETNRRLAAHIGYDLGSLGWRV